VNRRHLALIILLNAVISLAIAITVTWVAETRRPDPEELASIAGVASLGAGASNPTVDLPPTATSQVANAGQNGAESQAQEPAVATEPVAVTEPAGEPAATGGEPEIYIVQAGESLSAIADRLGVTVAQIVETNNLANPDFVFEGQRLIVPGSSPATATPVGPALGTTGLQVRRVNAPGNLAEEYVEIVNDTDLSFNLQGWRLQKGGGPEYIFGDMLVFPGGSMRLYSGTGTNTTISRYWGQAAAVWGSGATIRLINAQGEAVTEYTVP
jgi:LysM repeat protein